MRPEISDGMDDGDRDLASFNSALVCRDPSLAVQSQREDADINTIVKRFGLTGQLPQNVRVPIDLDFVDVIDYHTALNQLKAADAAFNAMPAAVRARFGNNAGDFVDFCSDPRNAKEMKELGLLVPSAVVEEAPGQPGEPVVP